MANPKNDFENFVKREQDLAAEAAAEDQTSFDPAKELKDWLGSLNALFSQINGFLKDYVSAGSITTEVGQIELSEEFSGPYTAPKMTIRIGLQEIKLIPIGTMLIGSKGRVDVIGRAGTSRLALVNKKITSPSQLVSITVVDPKKPTPAKRTARQPIEWSWKIVSRPPVIAFIELNKDTFFELLLEVSNA